MPNHVTTICTVTGPSADLEAFRNRHLPFSLTKNGQSQNFDFETVIPKPEVVKNTESSSESELGFMALIGDVIHVDFMGYGNLHNILRGKVGYEHARVVREHLTKENPAVLEKGRTLARALAETGYLNWREWSCACWGTKWNAYDFEEREHTEGRLVFKFETAWSFPEPIFRKLAEMYPALVFAVIAFDEGGSFGCDGEFNSKNDYRCSKKLATDEMYERVYGHPPERDDEEEANDIATGAAE